MYKEKFIEKLYKHFAVVFFGGKERYVLTGTWHSTEVKNLPPVGFSIHPLLKLGLVENPTVI